MSSPPPPAGPASVDYFISYTGKDQPWAEWIAWQLEAAGHTTLIQAWDFKSGGVFPADMHRALQNSARVIAVLTPEYLNSVFCLPEWNAAFADDPTGAKGTLVLVRVVDFKPDGLLRGRTYIDLVGKDEKAATTHLLERLKRDRAKPATPSPFPGAAVAPSTPAPAPPFPASPTPHLSTTTPNNLPRLQPFFGRETELAAVRDALHPDSRTWGILIDGPGGMGKTSLAVYAAYTCPPGQFDRIIFISIKDREMDDDGPRTLGNLLIAGHLEMLNELARELRQPDIPKAPEDQRIRLLLDVLREQKVLLILDNLESLTKADRDQIFAFVNRLPQGCKAILTSRRRIGGGGTEYILEKLDQDAALDLLAELAKHNPLLAKTSEAERIALYTQTAGKPLLLRWVAGQIGRGHCRTFTDALHFLRSCPKDNDPLEFIFGDLAQDFTPEEEAILSALTYFTLPAKVQHIATVANLDEPAATTALRSLANRSLVTPDQEEKEHTLVPLVADFLRHHRPQIVQDTGDRLERYAYAMIVENGNDQHDRFPILDAAWPSLSPAIPLFLARDFARLQTVCSALTFFLEFTGRWDEWLALFQKAETKAVAAASYQYAGQRAYQAGVIGYLRGQAEATLAAAERADAHWQKAEASTRERATVASLRGMGYELKGDYTAAINAFQEALELDRRLGTLSADVAIDLSCLADAESLSGRHTEAEGHYREALEVARAVGYSEGVATPTGNLAELAFYRHDWPTAEALARESLRLSEKVGRQELIAANCRRLAEALMHQNKAINTEALPHAHRAVEILTRLGSPKLAIAQSILTEIEAAIAANPSS